MTIDIRVREIDIYSASDLRGNPLRVRAGQHDFVLFVFFFGGEGVKSKLEHLYCAPGFHVSNRGKFI